MSKISSAGSPGILLFGPGAKRTQAILSNLQPLTYEQQDMVAQAKKYAMEQSLRSIQSKQAVATTQQQQKTLQRHQALVLMCRVYVGSISFELKEETIKAAFAPYGAIKSINMSWDTVTMKHKGFAFVEYEIPEAAQLALEHMNGIQLGGRQIKVGRPSNMPQAAPIIKQIQEECKEKNRIYVSNVHPDLSESELPSLFEPFGKVLSCKLALTPNVDKPEHRGYGFLEFETESAATEALTIDNFDLGGQALHVCPATTPADNLTIYGTLESELSQALASSNNNTEEDIQLQLELANKEQGGCDDKESELQQECDDEKMEIQTPPANPSQHNGYSSTTEDHEDVSNIIVLRNMVSADDDLDDSLQLDVYEECKKYGNVLQIVIYVDKKSKHELDTKRPDDNVDEVKIFVKYKNSYGSSRAREALNGRFFAGRKVSAEHFDKVRFRLAEYSHW